MPLITETNLTEPDAAYRLIVEAHRGLSEAHCASLDAALMLILANHIGDAGVLREALALARQAATAGEPGSPVPPAVRPAAEPGG